MSKVQLGSCECCTPLFFLESFLGLAFPSKGLASVCGLCTAGVCVFFLHQDREYTFKTETNQGLTVFLGHRCWQFQSSRHKPSWDYIDWTHPPVSSIFHFPYVLRTSSEMFASFVIAAQIHTRPMVGTVPYGIFQLFLDSSTTRWTLVHHFWDLPEVNERQSVETFQGSFPVQVTFSA